ncbi:MAG: isoprenylcysteine carboxylmethyltransferase family protein [Alphaproteobacteria bacterium]|nr:isoprenylcysteine carboxylmethyltransferase family protein [Alphaproteobacteria bacterium]
MPKAVSATLIRVPPIAIFCVVFAIGFVIDALAFGSPHIAMPSDAGFWIGLVLLIPAGYFGAGAFGMFLVRRMALMPGAVITSLVADGPFAFSRNPMYLGLSLLHAGLCLVLGLPLTFVLLVIPLLIMQLVVIPFEENSMAATFGADYADYRRRVRRWL